MSNCSGIDYPALSSDTALRLAIRQDAHSHSSTDFSASVTIQNHLTHSRQRRSSETPTVQQHLLTVQERRAHLVSIINQALELADSIDFADSELAAGPKR